MNKIKVAIVGGFTPNVSQIRGGVLAATAYLIEGLRCIEEIDLHILTMQDQALAKGKIYSQGNITIHLLSPYPRLERLRRYRNYQAEVNSVLAKIQPNLVHAQEAAAEALVALRSGYPTVVTAHGIRAEDAKYCQSWTRRLRYTYDALYIERAVIRKVQHLIAISHYLTDYFAPFLHPAVQKYYIPNAVDNSFFDLYERGIDEQAYRSKQAHPVVLFAGRVTKLKKVLDLLEAFARLHQEIPQAELRLAGECKTEPSYVASVQRFIKQAGLSDKVRLLGELPQDQLLREYSACSFVVLPSSQENLPMVLAQAMAAGKPFVATGVGGVPEMVNQGNKNGLLVNVGDINALTAAMIHLIKTPDLAVRMGHAGYSFALQNYHPSCVVRQTTEVYRVIVAQEGING